MDREFPEALRENLKWLGITAGILVILIGIGNLHATVPEEQTGFTDVYTECTGVDIGICLGLESIDHNTTNFDDYETPEEGSSQYYRMVEAELMAQAYNICDENTDGMEWLSEAEYDNQTAEEWVEHENLTLLPCEQTTWRSIEH